MAQLGTNHKLSTAFHPQTDGQTERLNQTMEQYLRSYVNYKQDNWVELLPLAQFAYNSALSEATKTSPFFANHGFQPVAYMEPRADSVRSEQAILHAEEISRFHQQLATDIQFLNERSASYANKKRSMEPTLKEGDRVYLLRKHIKTKRPSTKLDFKKLGPFRIIEKIGKVNFRLQLPKSSRLHPVFHVSLLEPARGDTPIATDTELQPENELVEYEVERIIDYKRVSGKDQYLVKWEGYTTEENTWEPRTSFVKSQELLRQFHQNHPEYRESPRKSRADRGSQGGTPRRTAPEWKRGHDRGLQRRSAPSP